MLEEKMLMEDWLRGCVHHDGRQGYVTLPTDRVLEIAYYIEKSRKPKWIPVSEKLPEMDEDVLVTTKYEDVRIMYRTDDNIFGNIDYWTDGDYIFNDDEILAWMPLPEPYKESRRMTREEAVCVIKDFVAYGEHVNAFVYKGSTSIPIDALNMAIEALEKEQERREDIYECPNCLGEVHKNYVYCPFCGRKVESEE